jgi:hypothetical protein
MASAASGAVLSAAPDGFEVSEAAHIAAAPDKVYAALVTPSRWWDPVHTFSRDASNLSLEPRAGGCWCERLPDGGSVEHMVVVWADPGKALRLHGTLGPLQGLGAAGALTFTIKPAEVGSDIEMRYTVGGYTKDGLGGLATPVDSVLGDQLNRLKSFVETGAK